MTLGPGAGRGDAGPDRQALASSGRQALESLIERATAPGPADLAALAAIPAELVDEVVRTWAIERGAAALPLLTALASHGTGRDVRRAVRRALFRLAQRGITPPPPPPAKPIVERRTTRAVQAWVSGIDGTGSRAVWVVFEEGYGSLSLCSVLISDTAGILEAAGGDVTKKRLARELETLRATQKLPWIEMDPGRVASLVAEALALHAGAGTSPPAPFERWRPFFDAAPAPELPAPVADPALAGRAAELLELPEFASWFLDPDAVSAEAVELLEAKESRLIVPEPVKAEREEAIVGRVIEREFAAEARARWVRRLGEMALVFAATQRPDQARMAGAAAAALADPDRDPRHHPLVQGLARRGLEIAGEVTLGRVSRAEVSRKPAPVTTAPELTGA
jgi:hypothetical protein